MSSQVIDTEEAHRWLSQAEHVLMVGRNLLDAACFAESCFYAEQAGQLALKAFLYGQGERGMQLSSVKYLAEQCATYDATFQHVAEVGKVLDQYYVPTRYPDALPDPAVPFESYTRQQADCALNDAREILELVKQKLGV